MTTPPKSFKVVAGICTAWMAIGLLMFALDMSASAEQVAAMTPPQQELRALRPALLMVVYAVSTMTGLLGGIGLLLRKRWSVALLQVSLVAVIVQFGWVLFGLPSIEKLGLAAAATVPAVVVCLGLWFALFARRAQANGWLS